MIRLVCGLNLSQEKQAAQGPQQKRKKPKFESEDWCIYCRDGGEVVLCAHCPRGNLIYIFLLRVAHLMLLVFHGKCRGLSAAQLKRGIVSCSQHSCTTCFRNSSESGGMLYRCVLVRLFVRTMCLLCLHDTAAEHVQTLFVRTAFPLARWRL